MEIIFSFIINMITCVLAYSRRANFIINGKNVFLGQFPSAVLIKIHIDEATYACGGTLIDQLWVLTAAHCVVDENASSNGVLIDIYAGFIDKNQKPEALAVSEIFEHELFASSYSNYDIALLKLKEPVPETASISPARLPENPNYEGLLVNTVGWGIIEDKSVAEVLRYITQRVTKSEACHELIKNIQEKNSVVCVTDPGKGTCYGDSGSGFYLKGTNVVVGLTSFGPGNSKALFCNVNKPTVGTDVYFFKPWIEHIMSMH